MASGLAEVLRDVTQERHRQDVMWGGQPHTPAEWAAILTKQAGHVAREVIGTFDLNPDEYRKQLIQAAAVAIAAVQALDARGESR